MDRQIDLNRLKEGDGIVVRVDEQNSEGAVANAGNVAVRIADCDRPVGSQLQVEILEIDWRDHSVLTVPADRPSLQEKYTVGERQSVSVDYVRDGDGFVSLETDRVLKIVDYPYRAESVEIVVTAISQDTVEATRVIRIDELSVSALIQINQEKECQLDVSADLALNELNVFTSHLLAESNWEMLWELLKEYPDMEKVDIGMATDILKEQEQISAETWRMILFTALEEIPSTVSSVGAEYLGAVLTTDQLPRAWRKAVKGNLAHLQEVHEVSADQTEIKLSPDDLDKSTVRDNALYIESRERERRDYSINTKLRNEWDECCSVCGHLAGSRHDKTGIEGAHIYPVQFGGPDRPGNILPMCRNHHWAFENGWFTISDDYTIRYHPDTPADTRQLLQISEDDELSLVDGYEPDRDYLSLHRRIHGFDPIAVGQRFPIKFQEFTLRGVTVDFPDGTKVRLPSDTLDETGQAQMLTVVVTEVSEDEMVVVPIQKRA